MVLKFDDIIYKNTFEIHAKDEVLEIKVAITDEESLELTEIMLGFMQGKGDNGRLDLILFKDNLEKLKQVLIGYNYAKFQKVVLGDFQNFIQGSIDDTIKNLKKQ